ncbi:ComEC/Rec2 family competence protein [Paenibacillus silviterrae]|uniref:ComEC/Rec2 family competence protein n=1 Tax=Paenibacillus silviterrae TaxID=3242194 RepID=UPI002543DE07|nr:MBL fold metallo-hydrolase [Paenibacillus chinjuensis]
MTNRFLQHGMKISGALVISGLLITAACTQVNPEPQQAAAPVAPAGESGKEQAPLRTKEVFDQAKYKDRLTIRYFHMPNKEVATGDSILIITPDGKTMLIDAGIPEAGSQIVQYLDQLGIQTLDIAFNTHPHSDHIGGYASILAKKEAKAFYSENLPYTSSSAYRNAMAQVEKKQIPHRTLEEGDTFELGEHVKFEVFSPAKGTLPDAVKTFDTSVLNANSLVIKMTYKNSSFLFPADIYKDKELELVELKGKSLDSDMVHAPHHGNATSSSPSFVETVSPQVAVLSSNIFNNLQILQRYERNNAKVYSTGLHGNILIASDGSKLDVVTEKDWSLK